MRSVYTFFTLSWQEKLLLCSTGLLVIAIRLGLWLLPFRHLQRILGTLSECSAYVAIPAQAERIPWAVALTSQCVPMATCLTQALAVQTLLRRRGIPCELRLGVAKDRADHLIAHAWVERDGQIVIGGSKASVARYVALPALEHGQQ